MKNICRVSYIDLVIFGDPNLLKIIFQNLIYNAIKYAHPGGNVEIIASLKNDFAEIIISDNGICIGGEIMSKLFSIEKKNSIQGTAIEKGSRFGLFLCKELIEIQRGKIHVESELGEGSNFLFSIPNQKSISGSSGLEE